MQNSAKRKNVQSEAQLTGDAKNILVLQQASFSSNRTTFVLSNISLKLLRGSLTVVVGPVGSGKSMLLKAILGELHCTKGSMQMQASLKVSYCDAHSWLRHRTLRDNILGPLEYDDEWYKTVIQACALEDDIRSLPQGHQTLIGSNGTSISGGQRQRIAIARALYAHTQLALFDDVLSALDARTSEHILTHVFGSQGLLRRLGMTVVLVTHGAHNLTSVDQVVVLKDGKILEHELHQADHKADQFSPMNKVPSPGSQSIMTRSPVDDYPTPTFPASHAVENVVDKKLGDLTDYSYYLKAAGTRDMLLYFLCLVIGAFCSQFPSKLMRHNPLQVFDIY